MPQAAPETQPEPFAVTDLGRLDYAAALEIQREALERVLARRADSDGAAAETPAGEVFFVEHDPPVITVTRRASASGHVLAGAERLTEMGVELHDTDRGGDVTYHGPGQLVCYPIFDLNVLGLGLHAYMRLLEQAVIDTCAVFGVATTRDPTATGVWTAADSPAPGGQSLIEGVGDGEAAGEGRGAKICAMGVRVRRWVTMHGLAINVRTDLSHFDLIVPCGLAGRRVTSLEHELGASACPSMDEVRRTLTDALAAQTREALRTAGDGRVRR